MFRQSQPRCNNNYDTIENRNFTSASLVATYYGVNIIYVCIIASTLKQVGTTVHDLIRVTGCIHYVLIEKSKYT